MNYRIINIPRYDGPTEREMNIVNIEVYINLHYRDDNITHSKLSEDTYVVRDWDTGTSTLYIPKETDKPVR